MENQQSQWSAMIAECDDSEEEVCQICDRKESRIDGKNLETPLNVWLLLNLQFPKFLQFFTLIFFKISFTKILCLNNNNC